MSWDAALQVLHGNGSDTSPHPTARADDHKAEPHTPVEPEQDKVLMLLSDELDGVTIATLHEHGVKTPAQTIYELALAGYEIDRILVHADGRPGVHGYRLRDHHDHAFDPIEADGSVDPQLVLTEAVR